MKKPDDKGLLNEVLPDPTRGAGERGTPRERTASHLNRLLAAAGLALAPGLARADNTVPGGGGKPPGEAKPGKKPDDAKKPEEPKPEPPGYGVVDPIPEPYIEKKAEPGFLRLSSKPSCAISIDGKATGLMTPQQKIKLSPGLHTITLNVPSSTQQENFTIEIRSNQTSVIVKDLAPPPKPAPKPPKPEPAK
ncbi:MAG TPA: hypothetical protein VFF06_08970 [Polyangia bacterium]|nr:hypothetical protein [Polyangia bacterium]